MCERGRPLGQGIATSVGMAIARKFLGARYSRPGFEMFYYNVYAVCGDGLAGCEFQASQKCLKLIIVYAISFMP
jgi:transketolase